MPTHLRRAAAWLFLALAAVGASAMAGNLQVLVLDKDGNPVPDAVVLVQSAARSTAAPGLPRSAVITQEKMRFVPAVTLVAVGARARFVNNDAWEHHVRASGAGLAQFGTGGGFELMIEGRAEGKPAKSVEAVFDKAGPVLLGCHLHGSMRGHVYVSDTPWAALTGADGMATLEAVPDGAATVRVWHADQLVDIAPQPMSLNDALSKATMQLSVVPRRRRL